MLQSGVTAPLRRVAIVAVALAASVALPMPAAAALPLTLVAGGFSQPLYLTNAGDARLFVVEKGGRVKIVGGGTFLDISAKVSTTGERGLLGLAFHPGYASNRLFYVSYTRASDGDIILAEYRRSAGNANLADPNSERIVLRIEHSSASNHNGGWIGFRGANPNLFMSVGDGGNTPDAAQDLSSLLGKILRINPVDPDGMGALTYSIPDGNPYVGIAGRDEIWARGLRNPWRCSHDPKTGYLWCGDVGQSAWEEIDRNGSGKKSNFGWPLLEGNHYYDYPNRPRGELCTRRCRVRPILEYPLTVDGEDNNAVTGGYVSRRPGAALRGKYVFGDFGSGRVWAIPAGYQRGDGPATLLADTGFSIASFGIGAAGRLYLVDLAGGGIYRLDDS